MSVPENQLKGIIGPQLHHCLMPGYFFRRLRVTKPIANIILQVAGSTDTFFIDRVDGLGKT